MLRSLSMSVVLLCALFSTTYAATESLGGQEVSVNRLLSLQQLLDSNAENIAQIRTSLKESEPSSQPALEQELELLESEQKKLRQSFEQVAIGSVDREMLVDIESNFDWQQEITLILQPIMENLKALTDKPRRISQLNAAIEQKTEQEKTITKALASIAQAKVEVSDKNTQKTLLGLQKIWEALKENNLTELEFAKEQLVIINSSDVTWWETLRLSAEEFFNGRGLTLIIAMTVAIIVWLFMRFFLWVFKSRTKSDNPERFRTRRRLVQYAYRAFVFLLIMMSVITVFYVRGDLLLLGLSIIAAATIVLGLRQAIPQFISEAQLLLNVGSIRENERVIYEGLPWQVTSINMYSILRNPELAGVLRLPLRDLEPLTSRPITNEVWFPTSRGDVILTEDQRMLEVTKQTPEVVELSDAGGSSLLMKSADFFGWSFKNLTRGETFGVVDYFGVDYQLQPLCLTEIPQRLHADISAALQKTNVAEGIKNVMVEFSSAGDSSLNYMIYVTVKSEYAKSYWKVKRVIQQTCVASCTDAGWNIPFPHLTIQQA